MGRKKKFWIVGKMEMQMEMGGVKKKSKARTTKHMV
jgi:hypothetical protein